RGWGVSRGLARPPNLDPLSQSPRYDGVHALNAGRARVGVAQPVARCADFERDAIPIHARCHIETGVGVYEVRALGDLSSAWVSNYLCVLNWCGPTDADERV